MKQFEGFNGFNGFLRRSMRTHHSRRSCHQSILRENNYIVMSIYSTKSRDLCCQASPLPLCVPVLMISRPQHHFCKALHEEVNTISKSPSLCSNMWIWMRQTHLEWRKMICLKGQQPLSSMSVLELLVSWETVLLYLFLLNLPIWWREWWIYCW